LKLAWIEGDLANETMIKRVKSTSGDGKEIRGLVFIVERWEQAHLQRLRTFKAEKQWFFFLWKN
jgi:hypothetical protein